MSMKQIICGKSGYGKSYRAFEMGMEYDGCVLHYSFDPEYHTAEFYREKIHQFDKYEVIGDGDVLVPGRKKYFVVSGQNLSFCLCEILPYFSHKKTSKGGIEHEAKIPH